MLTLPFQERFKNRRESLRQRMTSSADLRLLYLVAAMLGFGLLMIYSSSAVLAFSEGRSSFHFFFLQIVWIILGGIAGYIAYKIPINLIARYSIPILIITILGLLLVLFVGKDLNGARRWIDLGPFDLQPSEIAKLGFVIYLSAWLAKTRSTASTFQEVIKKHFTEDLLPFMMLLGIVTGLIVFQPDLDTAVIIAITSLSIYFVAGKDAIHSVGAMFIVATSSLVGIFAAIAAPYRLTRVQTYLQFWATGEIQDKRDAGFQVWNGLIAIGSGGLTGVGFGESRQKLFYLQNAAFTDSIFSIIAEEIGLMGSLIVIIAFLYFMSLGVNIAKRTEDKFSALLAMGITTWITLQAFLNIGANLALIPFGGIPLPFISYGGSSTIMVMVAAGILLNISKQNSNSSLRAVNPRTPVQRLR